MHTPMQGTSSGHGLMNQEQITNYITHLQVKEQATAQLIIIVVASDRTSGAT